MIKSTMVNIYAKPKDIKIHFAHLTRQKYTPDLKKFLISEI